VALKRKKNYAFFFKIVYIFCLIENCLHGHLLQNLEVHEGILVPIWELQPWIMPKGPTVMMRNLEGYMSAWEMLRHSLMKEEADMSLWLWEAYREKCRAIKMIVQILRRIGKRYLRAGICCRGKIIKTLAQRKQWLLDKWQLPYPIAEGMSMGMTGSQGVWESTIIPHRNPLI